MGKLTHTLLIPMAMTSGHFHLSRKPLVGQEWVLRANLASHFGYNMSSSDSGALRGSGYIPIQWEECHSFCNRTPETSLKDFELR